MKWKNSAISILLIIPVILTACVTGIEESEVAPVYYNLGNAYMDLGEYDKATEAYLRALDLDENLMKAIFNLAKVYIEKGEIDKAVSILNDSLSRDPDNAVLLLTLAYASTLKGDLLTAIELYEQIIERDPFHIDALYNSAIVYWQLKELDKAVEIFKKVVEIDPDENSSVYNLGLIYKELGDSESSIKYLSAYLIDNSEDFEVLKIIAEFYYMDEYYAKAMEIYDKILEISDNEPEIYFKKAFILLTVIGDYDKGLEILEKAVLAGYAEKEKYLELISHPGLLQKEQIEDYLLEKELLPSDS